MLLFHSQGTDQTGDQGDTLAMRFYLASSFSLIDKVEDACQRLERAGHEITVKWWSREYDIPGEGKVKTTALKDRYDKLEPGLFYERPETRISYDADFQGVLDADVFILIADDEPRAYNGANIELGIALASHKPCYSIGTLDNSVLYLDVTQCDEVGGVLNSLREGGILLAMVRGGEMVRPGACFFEGVSRTCQYDGDCPHKQWDGFCTVEDSALLTHDEYISIRDGVRG